MISRSKKKARYADKDLADLFGRRSLGGVAETHFFEMNNLLKNYFFFFFGLVFAGDNLSDFSITPAFTRRDFTVSVG